MGSPVLNRPATGRAYPKTLLSGIATRGLCGHRLAKASEQEALKRARAEAMDLQGKWHEMDSESRRRVCRPWPSGPRQDQR